MIRVRFRQLEGGGWLTVSGHAGAAPRGEDLVCAAASMLVYSLAQAVLELGERGLLKEAPEVRILPGEAVIAAVASDEGLRELRQSFRVARLGFQLLGESYPGNVDLVKNAY